MLFLAVSLRGKKVLILGSGGTSGTALALCRHEGADAVRVSRREQEGFYHTLIIVGFDGEDILVSAQTDDAYRRPLSTYTYDFARFIKIDGVRFNNPTPRDCFDLVYNGVSLAF